MSRSLPHWLQKICLWILICVSSSTAIAEKDNPSAISGRSNRPGDSGGGCGGCHGAAQSATVSFSGPTTRKRGQSGTYTITASHADADNGSKMGTIIAAGDSGTTLSAGAPLQYLSGSRELIHNDTLGSLATSSSDAASYTFTYTMPSNAAFGSSHTIYGVARLATSSGNRWNYASPITITTITPAPTINSATTKTGKVGVALSYQIGVTSANDIQPPSSYGASGRPQGINFSSSSGLLSGTPTTATNGAPVTTTLSATNSAGTDTQSLAFTISKGDQTLSFPSQSSVTYSNNGTFVLNGADTNPDDAPSPVYTSTTPSKCTMVSSSSTTVNIEEAGPCTIIASQPGNSNWNPATSVTRNIVINKATQTLTFGAQSSKTFVLNGTFNLSPSAYLSSGLAPVTESMTPDICSVSGNTVTMFEIGICTIEASHPGNVNYFSATPAVISQDISITAVPGTPLHDPDYPSQPGDGRAIVMFSAPANPASIIRYTATCTNGGNSFSANATVGPVVVTGLTNGLVYNCKVTATNSSGTGPSSTGVNVTPTASNLEPRIVSKSIKFPINFSVGAAKSYPVISRGNPLPTYSIVAGSLPSGVTLQTSVKLPWGILISGTPANGTVGSYSVTIRATNEFGPRFLETTYTDDETFTITVAKGNQTITFPAIADKTFSPTPFAITLPTASSGLGVTVTSTTSAICTYSGGNVTMKAVGICTLSATQAGNTNYLAATPVVRSFDIAQAPQTITFNAQTTATRTFSPGATFAINPLASTTSPLSITYASRSGSVCSVSGTTVTMVGAGTCILEASQDGSPLYEPAADVMQNVVITQAAQTINFPAQSNQAFVEGGSFMIGPLASASSMLAVSYVSTTPATCTVSDTSVAILSAGVCSIQATQAGDANFLAATPVVRSLNIQAVPPGVPTLDVAIPSDSKITLSVVAPVFTGGAPLTGFRATCNPGGVTGSAANSPLTVSGLTNGVAYSCSVVAQNVAGDSAPSNSIAGITPFLDTGANLWTGKCAGCHSEVPTGNRFNAAGTTGTVINYVRSAQAEMLASPTVQALSLNELAEIAKYIGAQLTPITANTAYVTPVNVDVGLPAHLYLGGVAFTDAQVVTQPANGTLSIFNGTVITYTPNVGFSGTDSFTYRGRRTSPSVVNGDPRTVTINVAVPTAPAITSANTANGVFGQVFNYQITATNSPASFGASGLAGGLSVNAANGLVSGTPTAAGLFNATVTATNPGGTGMHGVQITISAANQTITFGAQTSPRTFGGGVFPIATGTASSGLTVIYSSLTPGVCTVSGTNVTPIAAGTCTIAANQAGNGNYNAALQVTRDVTISASLPGAPTIGAAVGGVNQASLSFTPPANTGGSPVTLYTATCNPGGFTGNSSASPVVVSGLTNNTQYTCSVRATNSAGTGDPSGTVMVTPTAALVAPNITSANATTFTVLSAGSFTVTATGNLAPVLSLSGTLPSGVTFTPGTGALAGTPASGSVNTYPVTITATNASGAPSQSFTLTIAKANQTINFANPGTKSFSFVPFALTATATSNLGVTYTSNTPSVCTVSGSNVTTVATGVCSISADQAGNADYNAAPQVTQGFSVTAGPQTITFGGQTSPRNFSTTPFALSPVAFATSGLGIVYSTTTPSVCVMSGNNVATLTAGLCTIAANQPGNANYAAAPQVTQNVTVNAIPPGAPTIGVASGSDQQAMINFAAPANNGGATLSYTATCTASGQTTRTGSGASSPLTVMNMVNGIPYTCSVTATNSAGTGPASGTVMVTPTSADGEALWTSVCASCHASTPTGNQLNGAGSTATVLNHVRSLQPAMQINSGVQALNQAELASIAAYIGNNLAPNEVTTAQGVPVQVSVSGHITFTGLFYSAFSSVEVVTPPTNGMVSAFTGRTATYTPNPGFSGTDTFTYRGKRTGPDILGDPVQVTITVSPGAPAITSAATANGTFNQAFNFQITASGTPTSFGASDLPAGLSVDNVTGVISGTAAAGGTFNATVTATNGSGTGMAPLVITIAPAGQVITFNAQSPSSQSFVQGGSFAINPLASGGASGNGVTYSSTTPAVCTVSVITVTMVSAGTCTIAANQAGNSDYAAAGQVTRSVTINAIAPGAPAIGVATPGNAQAQIAFTAPASNGGSPIAQYIATCNPGGITGSGTTSTITVMGLTNNTQYTCSVTATNAAGLTGPASGTVQVTPVVTTVPGAPTIGVPVEGDGNVSLPFSPPGDNGGSAITNYTATCSANGQTTRTGNGTASPITVSSLTNGVTYDCSITATNSVGTGAASGSVQVTPASGIALTGVISRKTHGAMGTFDVVIDAAQAIGGAVTVESRAIGAGHQIVFQFDQPVTVAGTAEATDAGSMPVGSASAMASGNDVIVTVTGIPDNSRATISLTGVNGVLNTGVSLGFLIGDVNGNRAVNATDISGVKARSGQSTDGANFRFDLNASGGINATDIAAVKARSGLVLP